MYIDKTKYLITALICIGLVYGISRLLKKQIYYIFCPEAYISTELKIKIMLFAHFLPSLVISFVFVNRFLANIIYFENLFSTHNSSIAIFIAAMFIICIIVLGLVIEQSLLSINDKYQTYKKSIYAKK